MKDDILRSITTAPLVFGAFFALPFMADYILKKQHIRLIGWELILFFGPVVAIFLLINKEWETGIFFLAASLGSHAGFFKLVRRPNQF